MDRPDGAHSKYREVQQHTKLFYFRCKSNWTTLYVGGEKQCYCSRITPSLQPADLGLPTGNGKKLSCSQAQLGQAWLLLSFFPFPVGHLLSAGCSRQRTDGTDGRRRQCDNGRLSGPKTRKYAFRRRGQQLRTDGRTCSD